MHRSEVVVMKIAIDTNAYTAMARGDELESGIVRQAETILLPLIVLGELRAGFAHGNRSEKNENKLVQFLNSPRVEVLILDEQTTHHYARLYAQLRKQGTPIPTNDIWIAALVTQHDLHLLSRDSDFDNLPQISRLH